MEKQHKYQFTLLLSDVNSQTIGLEDTLFKAGCDDALINFKNGTVYLDFDRTGESFESVVISAIQNVESASVNAKVVSVAPSHLVSESDIARRSNMTRQAIHLLAQF